MYSVLTLFFSILIIVSAKNDHFYTQYDIYCGEFTYYSAVYSEVQQMADAMTAIKHRQIVFPSSQSEARINQYQYSMICLQNSVDLIPADIGFVVNIAKQTCNSGTEINGQIRVSATISMSHKNQGDTNTIRITGGDDKCDPVYNIIDNNVVQRNDYLQPLICPGPESCVLGNDNKKLRKLLKPQRVYGPVGFIFSRLFLMVGKRVYPDDLPNVYYTLRFIKDQAPSILGNVPSQIDYKDVAEKLSNQVPTIIQELNPNTGSIIWEYATDKIASLGFEVVLQGNAKIQDILKGNSQLQQTLLEGGMMMLSQTFDGIKNGIIDIVKNDVLENGQIQAEPLGQAQMLLQVYDNS